MVIVVVFFLLGITNSILLPLHKAPDEIAHFQYARFIAQTGSLPTTYDEREQAGYLSFWPPLYHVSVAALAGWSTTDSPPYLKFAWESPRFELVQVLLDTKRLANTEDELWPYRGDVLMWHLGRLVALMFGVGTIVVAYFTALEIRPKNYRLAVRSAAIIAFVPAFVFISSVMSYESLVGFSTALYFFVLVKIVSGDTRLRNFIVLGLLMGVSVTTKYSTVVLPLEVVAVFLYLALNSSKSWFVWLKWLVITAVAAIVASGWWFAFLVLFFNEIEQYGPVIGVLKPIIAGGIDASQNYVASILTGVEVSPIEETYFVTDPWYAWVWTMYRSLFAVDIKGYSLGLSVAVFIGVYVALAVAGLFLTWRYQAHKRKWVLLLLFHAGLFFLIPLLRFSIQGNISWTAQGRHVLFPVASVLPLLFIYGWDSCLTKRTQRLLALILVAGLLTWNVSQLIRVTDNYHNFHTLLPVKTTADVGQSIENLVEESFGDRLRLIGYNDAVQPTQNELELAFFWQSPAYPDEDYRVAVRLTQDDETFLNYSVYPTNVRYPTRVWESWETIRDDIWLPLSDIPPGAYRLELQVCSSEGPLLAGNDEWLTLNEITVPVPTPIQPDIPFSVSVEDRVVIDGITVLQAEQYRRLNLFEYRPRMQIPFVWQGRYDPTERVEWLLVGPQNQVYPSVQVLDHFGYFSVGPDWPEGEYRLRAEIWRDGSVIASQETSPVVRVVNETPRLLTPPQIAHPVGANFDNKIRLLGYNLPVRSLSAGEGVPVTLYWQGLRTMGRDYTVFVKLLDAQQQVWASVDRLPADGYSTIYWLEDEVVIDGFELPVDSTVPDGVYWFNVGLYEEVDQAAVSLPLVIDDQQTDVTSVTFGPVKIGGPPHGIVSDSAVPEVVAGVKFGDVIHLRGYDFEPEPEHLRLKLYWESLLEMDADYTVFVHVQNQAGEMVAQMDRPLTDNVYPSSLWAPGEVIPDEISVPISDIPPDQYNVYVGLYDFATGLRLPVAGSEDNRIKLADLLNTEQN
jgi:hypothetical protein